VVGSPLFHSVTFMLVSIYARVGLSGWDVIFESIMFLLNRAVVPRRRVLPALGPRGSRSSSLSVIIITDRLSYTTVDSRRPSFTSIAVAYVWNEVPRHVTSAPPVRVFCSRLKTRLFSVFFCATLCNACFSGLETGLNSSTKTRFY